MIYKKIFLPLLASMILAGCSQDDVTPPKSDDCSVRFNITKRIEGEDTPKLLDDRQQFNIFVGVDQKEETDGKSGHLHLFALYDNRALEGNRYTLYNLPEQFYRMAFFVLPKLSGIITQDMTIANYACDYNAQMIDFSKVLEAQKTDASWVESGHIYRQVLGFRALNGTTLTQDVELTRQNGQLILDMGILADQFENNVTKIEIILNDLPYRMYIRDNDNSELLVDGKNLLQEYTFTHNVTEQTAETHPVIALNLLPGKISGTLRVTEEGKEPVDYKIQSGYNADGRVVIKTNTRTILEFNGLHKDYFTVKYAGFSGSLIDVDDDQWDGWQQ